MTMLLALPGKGEYPVLGSGTSPLRSPWEERRGSSWLYSTLMTRLCPDQKITKREKKVTV
jgi:hypothetical protein